MSVDLYNFTAPQAEYAAAQLEKLWRERRFFLRDDYIQNAEVFRSLRLLEEKHRQAYKTAQAVAAGYLLHAERDLDIIKPDLNCRNLVQCNRFSGGLRIGTAWPLAQFAKYAPRSLDELRTEATPLFAPLLIPFNQLTEIIWKEFQNLGLLTTDSRVVVVLKTQFVPDVEATAGDLLGKPVSDLQPYPHALGYLLYRASLEQRLLPDTTDPRILTSTATSGHVSFCHLSFDPEPQAINFHMSCRYVKEVHFATVL